MITLTAEQAQQIEEALMKIADLRNLGKIQPEVIAFETLYIIRAAIAQPVLWQSKIVADCVSTVEMFNDEWRPLYAAPVRTKDLTDAVDAAMVEMQNINPPLRRSECERLIRAANYAAPVRTKNLTDDEIYPLYPEGPMCDKDMIDFARAVIAADREKNGGGA